MPPLVRRSKLPFGNRFTWDQPANEQAVKNRAVRKCTCDVFFIQQGPQCQVPSGMAQPVKNICQRRIDREAYVGRSL